MLILAPTELNTDTDKDVHASTVYKNLKKKILAFEFKNGSPLVEEALAEEFNVSRTPVREALRRLEQDGFVHIIPRKGSFVKALSIKDVEEIYTIREALEGISAKIAAELINEANLRMLEEQQALAVKKLELGDTISAFEVGNGLHEVILKVAGNSKILQIVANYKEYTKSLHMLSSSLPGRLRLSIDEHMEIIRAIRKRNAELAEKTVRKHIESTKKDVIIALKNNNDFF